MGSRLLGESIEHIPRDAHDRGIESRQSVCPIGTANGNHGAPTSVGPQDCIADAIAVVSGTTETNNFEAGKNGTTTAYTTLFDGPTFHPDTEAEAKAQLNPKVSAGAVIP